MIVALAIALAGVGQSDTAAESTGEGSRIALSQALDQADWALSRAKAGECRRSRRRTELEILDDRMTELRRAADALFPGFTFSLHIYHGGRCDRWLSYRSDLASALDAIERAEGAVVSARAEQEGR